MIPKNKSKWIRSLRLRKARLEQRCFTVEGKKSVLELLGSDFQIKTVLCTESFFHENKNLLHGKNFELILCGPSELESVSSFKTNSSVLAVAKTQKLDAPKKPAGLTLVLDGVNDPGNMGTILRVADWFGIRNIFASPDTTDFYNPKVIQASMGSFCRVEAHYLDLETILKKSESPIYAASRKGESAHNFPFAKDCLVILGSESHGISGSLLPTVSKTIGIPSYGKAESLNVAIAAAVICDNYRRLAG